jgi:hypothetical protein
MEARVAILAIDKVTLNGDIYPRDVVERAINLWNGQTMAIVHADMRPSINDPPSLADAVGVASHIRIDPDTNQVITNVKFKVPPTLSDGFVFTPVGNVSTDADGTVLDFEMTALVISPSSPEVP